MGVAITSYDPTDAGISPNPGCNIFVKARFVWIKVWIIQFGLIFLPPPVLKAWMAVWIVFSLSLDQNSERIMKISLRSKGGVNICRDVYGDLT